MAKKMLTHDKVNCVKNIDDSYKTNFFKNISYIDYKIEIQIYIKHEIKNDI